MTFHETKAASVQHAAGSSTLTCSDGSQLHSSFVLDCTGHARKLVTFDEKFDPGYQAAYGMMIEVESHPFDLDTMLFMDWRDDHTKVFCWSCLAFALTIETASRLQLPIALCKLVRQVHGLVQHAD